MAFTQSDAIEVKRTKGKGRGVFARRLIREGRGDRAGAHAGAAGRGVRRRPGRDGAWRTIASPGAGARWGWPWATARSTTIRTGPTPATTTWVRRPRSSPPCGTSRPARRSRSITTGRRGAGRRSGSTSSSRAPGRATGPTGGEGLMLRMPGRREDPRRPGCCGALAPVGKPATTVQSRIAELPICSGSEGAPFAHS